METTPTTSFVTSLATSTTSWTDPYAWETSTSATLSYAVAPLTTQFAAPTHCFDSFHLGHYSIKIDTLAGTSITVLHANTTGVYSSECWPSGFQSTTFRPGVCPSGWTYYNIHSDNDHYEEGEPTAADCCASGFTRTKDVNDNPRNTGRLDACLRHVKSTSIVAIQSAAETVTFTSGYLGHEPLRVQWLSSDVATLSPSPPELEYNRFVKSWVPGHNAKLIRERQIEGDTDHDQWEPVFKFLEIGLPLIIFFSILSCVGCCWCHSRNKRRRRWAREAEENRQVNAVTTAIHENPVAAEAARIADELNEREIAAAQELMHRHQAREVVRPSTPATTASLPKYSFDGVEDAPPPTYQRHPTSTGASNS